MEMFSPSIGQLSPQFQIQYKTSKTPLTSRGKTVLSKTGLNKTDFELVRVVFKLVLKLLGMVWEVWGMYWPLAIGS